jgi:hypothetical protein
MNAMYVTNISGLIGGKEYVPVLQDAIRMISINIVSFFMYSMRYSNGPGLGELFESTMYIILGVLAYWLVFRQLVEIV